MQRLGVGQIKTVAVEVVVKATEARAGFAPQVKTESQSLCRQGRGERAWLILFRSFEFECLFPLMQATGSILESGSYVRIIAIFAFSSLFFSTRPNEFFQIYACAITDFDCWLCYFHYLGRLAVARPAFFAGCCARAESGHAAAPLRSVMKSRRFTA
jgi:hypothetical protein